MEAEKRRYNQSAYIQGNTVRQMTSVPASRSSQAPAPRAPQRPYRQPVRRPSSQPDNRVELNTGIDLISMVVLAFAMVVVFVACATYIQAESQSIQMDRQISSLFKQVSKLTDDNDNLEVTLNQPVDLEMVYKIAVSELGMVHPNNSQIVEFDNSETGYVRQYDDVPESPSDRILEKLLP